MTVHADLVSWFAKLSMIVRPINVVTGSTSNPALIHYALHEIIALHAILVCGSIGKIEKICPPESDVFEFPVILQFLPNAIAERAPSDGVKLYFSSGISSATWIVFWRTVRKLAASCFAP